MNKELIKSERDLKWLLVYTKANQELLAKINLEHQKYKVFLPLIDNNNKNSEKKLSYKAVFPRYLFVNINLSTDNWLSINSTKGIQKLVIFGENLAAVPDKTIKTLKSKLDCNDIYHPNRVEVDYISGDKITIQRGKLKGLDAIFLSSSGEERSRLLLKFLSRDIVAEISSSDIGTKEIVESFTL